MQTLGDVLDHSLGILVEQGVVLDNDQGVAGLFKNGHEMEYGKSSIVRQVKKNDR
jgi:hypothetical protein